MPTPASVTITAGIYLAVIEGIFNLNYLGIRLAGLSVIILAGPGFGILLPNQPRILREPRKDRPDIAKIGRLGLLNARLAGAQAVFRVALIFLMANLAVGLVNL